MMPLSQNRPAPSSNNFLKRQPEIVVRPNRLSTLAEIEEGSVINLEKKYGNDLDKMCGDHENLIKVILEEEDDLIATHRDQIDIDVDLAKQEMSLLEEVDQP